jgi:predicted acyltransferase
VVSGLSGVLAGILLRRTLPQEQKLIGVFVTGSICMLAGWIWDGFFPINKNIWTSSYVVYTTGLACLTFGVLYWFIDMLGYRRWATFFVVFGINAITAYVASEFLLKTLGWIKIDGTDGQVSVLSLLYTALFAPLFSPVNASLAMAICWVLLFFIPLYVMYRKKLFVKV